MLDARVVDQDVDLAECVHGMLDHLTNRLGPAHVRAVIDDLDGELAGDCGAGLLDLGDDAEAVDQDLGALGGKPARDAEADAAGRARDDRRLAGERAHGRPRNAGYGAGHEHRITPL